PLARCRLTFAFFVAVVVALATVVVVFTVTRSSGRGLDVPLTAVVVTVIGVAFAALGRRARGRLHCGSRVDALRSYRARLVRCGFLAEVPAAAGFVAFLLTDNIAVFMVGAGFAVIGLATIAPSRRNLEAEEHEFARRGCRQSLVGALLDVDEPPRVL
ncbi:MAG: hypothetical protein ACRDZV_05420, partial [Acidimicrobiia bacterium]